MWINLTSCARRSAAAFRFWLFSFSTSVCTWALYSFSPCNRRASNALWATFSAWSKVKPYWLAICWISAASVTKLFRSSTATYLYILGSNTTLPCVSIRLPTASSCTVWLMLILRRAPILSWLLLVDSFCCRRISLFRAASVEKVHVCIWSKNLVTAPREDSWEILESSCLVRPKKSFLGGSYLRPIWSRVLRAACPSGVALTFSSL